MKVVKFISAGRHGVGVLEDDNVLEVGGRLGTVGSLLQAVADGIPVKSQFVQQWSRTAVEFSAPVDDTARIFCIAQNYPAHAAEIGGPKPPAPVMFLKLVSSLAAPSDRIRIPEISTFYDYEGELAAVICRAGKRIAATDALQYVGGYTILNDGTARDLLRVVLGGKEIIDWYSAKSLDAASPAGPWVVSADEVGDPQRLRIETRLNGEVVQSDVTSSMVFSIADQIEYVSRRTALRPGDVFATGTPGGVGWARKRPLAGGDVLQIEVDRIGILEASYVAQEAS